MPLLVYLDETGTHSLEIVDRISDLRVGDACLRSNPFIRRRSFPPYRLKMDYFGHEGVILHSRDIRKAVNDFSFLLNPQKRSAVYQRINEIMAMDGYTR